MFGYVPPVERRPRGPRAGRTLPLSGAAIGRLARRADRRSVSSVPAGARRSRRGLIIDLDDTLYPRERFVRSGLAAVAQHVNQHYGIAIEDAFAVMTRALAHGHAGAEMQALCARFDLPVAAIGTLIDVFRAHTPTLFLADEAAQTLRELRSQGWALAILTNGLPSVQFRKVAGLGLSPLVDEVVYAEEHAPGGKPSAAPFRAALRALDLDAGDCVCVGDDPARDVRGARALGIATIRLARPATSAQVRLQPDSTSANVESGLSRIERPTDEADVVIDSLRQLPEAAALLLRTVTADVA
jgi:putative hydrolase of the HAD superfamily